MGKRIGVLESRPEFIQRVGQALPEFVQLNPYSIISQTEQGHPVGVIRAVSTGVGPCGHGVEIVFHYLQIGGVNHYREVLPAFFTSHCPVCRVDADYPREQSIQLLHNIEHREVDARRTATLMLAVADYLEYVALRKREEASA
jgi:hypothetical protein